MKRSTRIIKKNAVISLVGFFISGLLLSGEIMSAPGKKTKSEGQPEESRNSTTAGGRKTSVTLEDFIRQAASNNPAFQKILVDTLYLQYREALELPPGDFLINLNGEYGAFLGSDTFDQNDYSAGLEISKLFPDTGTTISASYNKAGNFSRNINRFGTVLGAEISQSVIQNAFGANTRRLRQSVELQTQMARHQVLEAYEDYLALLTGVYLDWFRSYREVKILEDDYQETRRVYRQVVSKKGYGVARVEDVERSRLQMLQSREELLSEQTRLEQLRNEIRERAGFAPAGGSAQLRPVLPRLPEKDNPQIAEFDPGKSRTMKILKLMEENGILLRQVAEDNLLPSAELFGGYNLLGQDVGFAQPEHKVYFGFRSQLNFQNTREGAREEVARLDERKARLNRRAGILDLNVNIENIRLELARERRLLELAGERLTSARRLYTAESRRYSIGRTSLVDLISARGLLRQAERGQARARTSYFKTRTEYNRLTDQLVRKLPEKRPVQ